eukprot:tig00001085_g6954.t1
MELEVASLAGRGAGSADDLESLRQAFRSLAQLSQDEENRGPMIREGVVGTLLAAMSLHAAADVELMSWAITTLLNLAKSHATQVLKEGAVKSLYSVINVNQTQPHLLAVSFNAVLVLSRADRALAVTARLEGVLSVVISALKAYVYDVDLASAAADLLCVLLRNDGNVSVASKEGTVSALLAAIYAHSTKLLLLAPALAALARLVEASATSVVAFVREEGWGLVLHILKAHNTRSDICRSAIAALKGVALAGDSFAGMVRQAGAFEAVRAAVLLHFQNHPDILKSAFRLLWVLRPRQENPYPPPPPGAAPGAGPMYGGGMQPGDLSFNSNYARSYYCFQDFLRERTAGLPADPPAEAEGDGEALMGEAARQAALERCYPPARLWSLCRCTSCGAEFPELCRDSPACRAYWSGPGVGAAAPSPTPSEHVPALTPSPVPPAEQLGQLSAAAAPRAAADADGCVGTRVASAVALGGGLAAGAAAGVGLVDGCGAALAAARERKRGPAASPTQWGAESLGGSDSDDSAPDAPAAARADIAFPALPPAAAAGTAAPQTRAPPLGVHADLLLSHHPALGEEPLGTAVEGPLVHEMMIHDVERWAAAGPPDALVYDALRSHPACSPAQVSAPGRTSPDLARPPPSAVAAGATPAPGAPNGSTGRGTPRVASSVGRQWTSPQLEFESRFESGNLRAAVRVGDREYDLTLEVDVASKGHTQWFYFAVVAGALPPPAAYKFNIINLEKPNSQFNFGMRPLMYSTLDAASRGVGWVRAGTRICYYPNQHTRQVDVVGGAAGRKGAAKAKASTAPMPYYTLTFSLQFHRASEEGALYYIAYHYPYTFTDLQRHLGAITVDPRVRTFLRRQVLCYTNAGRPCDLLTITSPGDAEAVAQRRVAVLTARVHPGESNASWIMKGVLDFLTGNSAEAQRLRDTVVFKVVPMLNPDGVVAGNYRTSLTGVDLNRQWTKPSALREPTIFHCKELVRRLHEERGPGRPGRGVFFFCDFHGHSRRKNVFMYGCCNLASKDPTGVGEGESDEEGPAGDGPQAKAAPSEKSSSKSAKGKGAVAGSVKARAKRGRPGRGGKPDKGGGPGAPGTGPSEGAGDGDGESAECLTALQARHEMLSQRLFPRMLRDRAPHLFSLELCCFRVQKSKASTARVALWRELGLRPCYTLEASFCGADLEAPQPAPRPPYAAARDVGARPSTAPSVRVPATGAGGAGAGPRVRMHFNVDHLAEVGRHFCGALLEFIEPPTPRLEELLREFEATYGLAPLPPTQPPAPPSATPSARPTPSAAPSPPGQPVRPEQPRARSPDRRRASRVSPSRPRRNSGVSASLPAPPRPPGPPSSIHFPHILGQSSGPMSGRGAGFQVLTISPPSGGPVQGLPTSSSSSSLGVLASAPAAATSASGSAGRVKLKLKNVGPMLSR